MCDETEGEEEGAGELSVDGESDEQGDELSGLETGGIPLPPRKREREESGRTSGRGLGLALGRDSRLPMASPPLPDSSFFKRHTVEEKIVEIEKKIKFFSITE